jgi:hypothetical protein
MRTSDPVAGYPGQEFLEFVEVVEGLGQGKAASAPGAVKPHLASAAADDEPFAAFLADCAAVGRPGRESEYVAEHCLLRLLFIQDSREKGRGASSAAEATKLGDRSSLSDRGSRLGKIPGTIPGRSTVNKEIMAARRP